MRNPNIMDVPFEGLRDTIVTHVYVADTWSNNKIKIAYKKAANEAANAHLYALGRKKPNFPVPAIRYSDELVHGPDRVHFFVMYPHPFREGYCKIVGDGPNIQI